MASEAPPPLFKKRAGGGKREIRTRTLDELNAAESTSAEASSTTRKEKEEGSVQKEWGDDSSVVLKKRKIDRSSDVNSTFRTPGFSSRRKGVQRKEEVDADDEDHWTIDHLAGPEASLSALSGKSRQRDDATRTNTWYDDDKSEGKARMSDDKADSVNNNDGLYHGASAYSKFVTPNDDGISSKAKAAARGPVRAGNNVRTVTMFDYQPDVCKDYKETGYCGFGDTCKFLHDRSDYLAGWQLDALPNSAARARQRGDLDEEHEARSAGDGEKREEEDIPFACLICRKPFTDPIMTKCGHYFCSACAIKRYAKSSKCFACGKQTQGIFNSAKKVLERMQRARAARQEQRDERLGYNIGTEQAKNDVQDQHAGQLVDGVEVEG